MTPKSSKKLVRSEGPLLVLRVSRVYVTRTIREAELIGHERATPLIPSAGLHWKTVAGAADLNGWITDAGAPVG